MIVSKQALKKIKNIINKNYNNVLLSIVGPKALDEDDLTELSQAGIIVPEGEKSLLELIYYNNVLNELRSATSPRSIPEMRKQQKDSPSGGKHDSAVEHINESFIHAVENMKAEVRSRIEGFIRDNNMEYRSLILQNPDTPENVSQLVRESSVGKLKQRLRDYSNDVNRNWERIAVTETSNAMGLGSADRIIDMNKDKSLEEVYVYRIPVNDAALCKHCRKFYLDGDLSPAVYKMSTLLANGTNYGKKTPEWKAVIGATHPNDRESGAIELRPGWRVLPEGKVEFIGEDKWHEYIQKKLRG